MNIGIDAGAICVNDDKLKTGVYRINLHLLEGLSKLDKKNNYLLYSFSPINKNILKNLGPNFKNLVLTPTKGWLSLRLSLELFLKKPDIFLGLSQALPLYYPPKSLLFVYDLAFELYPNCYSDSKKLSRQTQRAVNNANKIITISNSTKNDLTKFYNIDKKKIEVIYPGIEDFFKPQESRTITEVKEEYGLSKPYVLFVGSLKPIKNIERILFTFQRLPENLLQKYQLVITGSNYWIEKPIFYMLKKMQRKGLVRYLGFVEDNKLPALYSGAEVFLSPSLYEGFGLPLLEAASCDCPIITSNCGSMPEVISPAAKLVNPLNSDEILNALEEILNNKDLRDKMGRLSLERAEKFPQETFAKKVYHIINTL